MGDNWGVLLDGAEYDTNRWLPRSSDLGVDCETNRWLPRRSSDLDIDRGAVQEPQPDWTSPIERVGRIRPLPVSPYGELLFRDVMMNPYRLSTPWANNRSNPGDGSEQICYCNRLGQNWNAQTNSATSNLGKTQLAQLANFNLMAENMDSSTLGGSNLGTNLTYTSQGLDASGVGRLNSTLEASDMHRTSPGRQPEMFGINRPEKQGKEKLSINQMFETIQQNQMLLLNHLSEFQTAAETRLSSLELKAGTTIDQFNVLGAKVDTALTDVSSLKTRCKNNTDNVNDVHKTLKDAVMRIEKLEQEVMNLDRFNRSYSLKILNVPEESNEDCRMKVASIIKENKLLPNCENLNITTISYQLENAHRLGKIYMGRRRHILVRFHAVPFRDMIIRTVKKLPGGKTREGYVFLDDLNEKDREIKDRNSHIFKSHFDFDGTHVLYKKGKFLVKGEWLTEEEFQRSRPAA